MKSFFAGLGIGAVLGVLFAPSRGEVTRQTVRECVMRLLDDFGPWVGKAKGVIQETKAPHSRGPNGESTKSDCPPKKDQAREIRPSVTSDLINTLSREELLNVNGVGSTLADKIISSRPYSSRQELVQRGISSQNTLEELERELSNRERRSAQAGRFPVASFGD
jgi:gas vesicle protein